MIKVLQVVKALEKNGVTSVILTYSHNVDKEKFQMDIVTGTLYEKQYRDQLEADGCNFYVIPNRDKNPVNYILKLSQLIKKEHYSIVHVHGNSAMIFPELIAAKIGGAKVRIAHSHNTMCNHPEVERFVRPLFDYSFTHGIACSNSAGAWMFKKKNFIVINNGIDTKKTAYSEQNRNSVRLELGIQEDAILVGHVGFFNYQKNHPKLISIFEKIHQENVKTKLLLIGDGPDREAIEKMVKEKDLLDCVIFYGQSTRVPCLMSAMDVFVLPSNFEGTPIVLLEAQASGMKCVTSADFPKDASIAIIHLDLEKNDTVWASEILQAEQENWGLRLEKSKEYRNYLISNQYDAQEIGKELSKYYSSTLK